MSEVDKWYRNYWARHKAREVMYQTLRAPCLSCEDCVELNEMEQAIFNHTKEANRLLDFGAGDNRVKRKFLAAGFKGSYETLDVSDTEKHTYSSCLK
jgi:hypothetical protein